MTTLFYKDYNPVTLFFFFFTQLIPSLNSNSTIWLYKKMRDETRRILVFFFEMWRMLQQHCWCRCRKAKGNQGKPGRQATRQQGNQAARQQGSKAIWQDGSQVSNRTRRSGSAIVFFSFTVSVLVSSQTSSPAAWTFTMGHDLRRRDLKWRATNDEKF